VRIAFDLRYASDRFPGIGTHAIALLEALLDLPHSDAIEVLWDPAAATKRSRFDRIRAHPKVAWTEFEAPAMGASGAMRVGGWLRRIHPDVYLSPYFLAPWRPRAPVVLTLHDVQGFDRPREFAWQRLATLRLLIGLSARSAHWMTSSEFSRERIRERTRIPEARLHLVRPGVPPGLLEGSDRRPERAPAGPFALTVGINKPHKNLDTLVRAWASFDGSPPLDLVSAGPVDRRYPDAETLAARLGAQRVVTLGRVSGEELRWLYRNAALFVFPTGYEGFGFPLLEAMAFGLAAVASDIPALRELGGDAPLWVPERDPEAWTAAVRSLCENRVALGDRSRAGRARSLSFDYSHTARAARAVLEKACEAQ
jgi:alpha-1,3-rhamnosyl/mannosyltransferase